MKTPVFNETPLVLLAVQADRTAGQVDEHAHRSVPVRRAGARQCHRGRTGARQGRHFPRPAGEDAGRHRRLSAAQHAGLRAECRHARRHLPHAGDLRRHQRGVHPHQSGAALSRQRPARSRLRDRAHGRSGRRRAEDRSGRAAPAQLHFAARRCRSRPGSPSPTTAASSRRTWIWRSQLADYAGFEKRAQGRARQRGKLLGIGISNTIERAAAPSAEGAEVRFDRGGSATLYSGSVTPGPGPRDHVQATGVRRARARSQRGALRAGRHRRRVLRRGHRRLALGHHGRLGLSHGDREGDRQGAC